MFSLFAVEPSFPLACFSFRRCPFFYKKERATKKLEAVNKHFCETRVDNITQSAFFVLQKLFVPSSTGFCTFSLLEEKNCTKRETGKGARKPFVPSDEPEQSSDNVLGNSFLPPSRSPRIAVSPGRIKLSHPALRQRSLIAHWLAIARVCDERSRGNDAGIYPT